MHEPNLHDYQRQDVRAIRAERGFSKAMVQQCALLFTLPLVVPEVDVGGVVLLDKNIARVLDRGATASVDSQRLCHHLCCAELNGQRCGGNICLFHNLKFRY